MKNFCCNNPKFRNVTHVIFDLDGTLIDSEKIYREALEKTVNDYGRKYSDNLSIMICGKIQIDVAKTMIDYLSLDVTIQEFLDKYNGYASTKLGNIDLMPGAEKLILHLYDNNIPMAVATSSQQESFNIKTQRHRELFDLFHHVVCGGTDPEVKHGKPAPDICLICAARFEDNPNPSNCLVFEDSANGVKSALAAGMQVVMIPDEKVPYDIWKLATLRIDSLDYMMPQLFGLPPFPQQLENMDEINPNIFEMKNNVEDVLKEDPIE